MAVTAKFRVSRVSPWGKSRMEDGKLIFEPVTDDNGDVVSEVTAEVELTPDYGQGRNADWAKATPAGVIRMTITNPAALEYLAMGKPMTVTFEAEEG